MSRTRPASADLTASESFNPYGLLAVHVPLALLKHHGATEGRNGLSWGARSERPARSGAIEEDAACMLIYEDKDDRARTLQAGTYACGPVKTWLKLGKNRYGLQGLYLPLFHAKKYTRFDVAASETERGGSDEEPAREVESRWTQGRQSL